VTRAIALIHRAEELPLVKLGVSIGETTAICVSPPGEQIEAVLADARTAGAVRTVRLWDNAVEMTDYLGVGYTLAAAVKTVLGGDLTANPAVILCGDLGRGAVGAAVAERLGIPHLGDVVGASMMEARVVARRRSGALVRLYASRPPVVLCVSSADVTATGTANATGTTEAWTLQQAGLTGAELAYRKRFRPLPSAGPVQSAKVFADVAQLVERLRADGVLAQKG
jgi:electron transfer flavoprotein alpha/beta subunit